MCDALDLIIQKYPFLDKKAILKTPDEYVQRLGIEELNEWIKENRLKRMIEKENKRKLYQKRFY